MEALSCARLGLLIAGGRFDGARRFAAELRAVADRPLVDQVLAVGSAIGAQFQGSSSSTRLIL